MLTGIMVTIIMSIKVTKIKKTLINSFLSLSILKGGQLVIPLVTVPYLIKIIGLEAFGLISFASSLALYFGTVIQYGFRVTGTRDISRCKSDVEISKVYSALFSAGIILSCICFIVFVTLVLIVDLFNQYALLYLIVFLFVMCESLFPLWFFQGVEKMKFITYITLFGKFMFMVFLLLLVNDKSDYLIYPALNLIFSLVNLILAILIIKFHFKIKFIYTPFSEVFKLLSDGRSAFIIQFMPNMYNNSAMFILGIFGGNMSVGVYSAATRVIEVFMSIGQVLSNTFLPYLSKTLKKHGSFLSLMIISGFIITVSIALGSDLLSNFFYNDESGEISRCIMLLSPWILLVFIRNALGVNYLMLMGFERPYSRIISLVSCFGLILSLYLIPKYNINGAISVILISSILMSLFTIILYVKVRTNERY